MHLFRFLNDQYNCLKTNYSLLVVFVNFQDSEKTEFSYISTYVKLLG